MAETIKGINVVIGADTTKLSKALSDVNQKSKDIQSELRQVERLLKFDPGNTELLTQKQKLLANAVENTREKLQRLKIAQQQVAAQLARGEISEGQYRAFQREVAQTEQQLQRLQGTLRETSAIIDKKSSSWGRIQKSLSNTGEKMRDVGSRIQSVGQEISMSFGVATAAIGGALGFAVKKSMDFEAQMSRVGAIAGASGKDLKRLKDTALELGAKTSKSAQEVAVAMEEMAAKGYAVNEIIAAMPGVIAAAEASGEDMALVADTVSSALNAFGLSAKNATHVADVLAEAANRSAAGVQDMQYAFKYAAPVAKSLGISLEELAAATGIMSDAGIKGEQAGTTLRAALLRLANPPKKAAEALNELGIKVKDSQGNFLPLGDIIEQLAEKTKGMSDAQKATALSTIFGTEAVSGMLALIEEGPAAFDKFTKSLENSSGASKKAADKMKDNLKGALEELSGAFETAQIVIGDALAPAIRKVAEFIQQLIEWFNNLSPSMQKFVAIGTAVAAVLTGIVATIGVVLAVIGGAVSGIGALTTAFGAISGAIATAGGMAGIFSTAIAAITGPVGIAIAAITGLVTVGVLVYKNWDEIKSFLLKTWEVIKATAVAVWGGIKTYFTTVLNIYKTIFTAVWEAIKTVLTTVWNALKTAAMTIWNGIKVYFTTVLNAYKTIFTTVWNAIKTVLTAVWNALKTAASTVFNAIKTTISTIFNTVRSVVTSVWNGIKSTLTGIWNGLKSTASSVWNGIKSAISTAANTAKSAVSNAFSAMRNAVSSIMSHIKSTISSMWNNVVSYLKGINLYSIGKNIIEGLAKGISSMGSAILKAAKGIADKVKNTIKKALKIASPSKVMIEYGEFTGEGFALGIERTIVDIKRRAADTVEAVTGILTDFAAPSVQVAGDKATQQNSYAQNAPLMHVDQLVIREEADVNRIAEQIFRLQQQGFHKIGVRI